MKDVRSVAIRRLATAAVAALALVLAACGQKGPLVLPSAAASAASAASQPAAVRR